MKKITTLILVFTCIILNGQEKTSFSDLFSFSASYYKANLILRSGDTLSGIARINTQEEIIFKKKEKDEKIVYNYKTVSKVILEIDGDEIEYIYKIIIGRRINGIMLLEPYGVFGKDKLNLFVDISSGSYNMNGFQGNTTKTTYFIGENNNTGVTHLGIGNTYSKKFKKIAKDYFKSCPDLLEKINNKYFRRYGIRSIMEYYDQNCER
ncbi:hypothetical protein SHK09_15090 [Polaribacter sp. PL03]|uniref:hypothetical protein n=2 Tax=Polaribacter sp. PL03 TaxID=3088353 RepID=UPI0029D3CC58|nr:hypothetical protein [Polaribacter sp. PL03]MDX6748121.1 hypothetical protein [Polaribacter sp. PL03]